MKLIKTPKKRNDKLYYANYVVAMVDVLGFRDLWRINEESIVKMNNIYQNLINTTGEALTSESISYILPCKKIHTIHSSYVMFSDTILIWQELHKDIDISKDLIVIFLRSLSSLFMNAITQNIYLRGGVAIGDCIINHSRTGEFRFSPGETSSFRGEAIFLGMPIVHAYELENAQEWIGIAFHQSFINYIGEEHCQSFGLVKYKVPLKNEKIQVYYALPWLISNGNAEKEIGILEKSIDKLQSRDDIFEDDRDKVIKKYRNTIDFIKQIKTPV